MPAEADAAAAAAARAAEEGAAGRAAGNGAATAAGAGEKHGGSATAAAAAFDAKQLDGDGDGSDGVIEEIDDLHAAFEHSEGHCECCVC